MSKRLIIFAQKGEAEASLSLLKAEPVPGEIRSIWSEGEITSCYTCEQGWIIISDIGVPSAQMCVAKYASQVDEIWNLGLCGALRSGISIGSTIEIMKVGKYIPFQTQDPLSLTFIQKIYPEFHLSPISPPRSAEKSVLNGSGGKLITSDFPIHDLDQRKYLAEKWEVVDMEGYGIAFAAHYLGKKCRMWKIVSDFASPGGRELIQKHKKKLSEILAGIIYETIHESRPHP